MEEASEPKKAETTPRDDKGAFVVEEKQESPTPATLPTHEKEEPKKEKAPAPAPAPAPKKAAKKKVDVSVAALVYSERKRNSVSVGVLQDRLAALGYAGSRSDFRGWFHDGTVRAIRDWQKDNGLEVTGKLDKKKDLEFLFNGTDVALS
jgi:Putative peptidoglycan binding domain.